MLSAEGSFSDAIEHIAIAVTAFAHYSAKGIGTPLPPQPTPADILAALESMDQSSRASLEQQFVYTLIIMPAVLKHLTSCQGHGFVWVDSLLDAVECHREVLSRYEHWRGVLDIAREASSAATVGDLRKLATKHTEAQSQTIIYLYLSSKAECQPMEVAGAHAVILEFLASLDPLQLDPSSLPRFITRRWVEIMDRQAFNIGIPTLLRDSLNDLPRTPNVACAAALVLTAIVATGANVSQSLCDRLREFANWTGGQLPPRPSSPA